MLKKLLVVFASGTVLCLVALSLAWLAGGKELHRQMAGEGGFNWSFGEDDDGPRVSRRFAVDGGQTLVMEVPVNLHFSRGPEAKMIVSGPKEAIDKLAWADGHLTISGGGHVGHGLDVTIVAPEIAGLDLEAPGDIVLAGLDQERLRLKSDGAVDLQADGRVRQLFVETAGASDLDFHRVEAEDATIRVDGAGDVSINASGLVDVAINGVGDVTLHREPAKLRTHVNGVGSVKRDF